MTLSRLAAIPGARIELWLAHCIVVLVALCACSREASPPPAAAPADPPAIAEPSTEPQPAPLSTVLDTVIEPHNGDLDEMLKRRQIRALVAIDRTHFFFDRGAQKGITADALVEFDRWVNKELKTRKNLKMQIVVVPVRRDQLMPALLTGRGDVIAAYVTDTPARRKVLDFADAGFQVTEVFVSNSATSAPATIDDLSGREVWVRRGSAYFESLEALNRDLTSRRIRPVLIRELDPTIENDEVLEMVNAGVLPATVADRYVARLWAPMLPELRVHETIQLRADAPFTWAVRKENPKLRELVSKFQKTHGEGTLWGNMKLRSTSRRASSSAIPARPRTPSGCGKHVSSSSSTARATRSIGCCSWRRLTRSPVSTMPRGAT